MTKKIKKKDISNCPKCNEEDLQKDNVYLFHNIQFNLHIYINADGHDDAMKQFDLCQFKDRKNWKVFLECAQQPS